MGEVREWMISHQGHGFGWNVIVPRHPDKYRPHVVVSVASKVALNTYG
jgi:hypothetical protein